MLASIAVMVASLPGFSRSDKGNKVINHSPVFDKAIRVTPLRGAENKYIHATFANEAKIFKKTPIEEIAVIPKGDAWRLSPESHLFVNQTSGSIQTLFSLETGDQRSDMLEGIWHPYPFNSRFAIFNPFASRTKKIFDAKYWQFKSEPFLTMTTSGTGDLILINEEGARTIYEAKTMLLRAPEHFVYIDFPESPNHVALRIADPSAQDDVGQPAKLLTSLRNAKTMAQIGTPTSDVKPIGNTGALFQVTQKFESWVIDGKDGHMLHQTYTVPVNKWQIEWSDVEWFLLASPAEKRRVLVSRKHDVSYDLSSDDKVDHDPVARTVTRTRTGKKFRISLSNGRETELAESPK